MVLNTLIFLQISGTHTNVAQWQEGVHGSYRPIRI